MQHISASDLLEPLAPNVHAHTRNFGVIFIPALKFDKHINNVVKCCSFQLLHIVKLKPFLSFNHISELLCPLSNSRSLGSSDHILLTIPRSRPRSKGNCAFAVAAEIVIPFSIKFSPSVDIFEAKPKTNMISQTFECP